MGIDGRWFAFSVTAVLTSLAFGFFLGSAMPQDRALLEQQARMIRKLEAEYAGLRAETERVRRQNAALSDKLHAIDQVMIEQTATQIRQRIHQAAPAATIRLEWPESPLPLAFLEQVFDAAGVQAQLHPRQAPYDPYPMYRQPSLLLFYDAETRPDSTAEPDPVLDNVRAALALLALLTRATGVATHD